MPQAVPIARHALASDRHPAQHFRLVGLPHFLRGNLDLVHRHDFYELLWVRQGSGTHEIDFVTHPLQDNTLVLLAPDQVHYLRADAARLAEALILIFNEEFLVRDPADRDLLQALAPPAGAPRPPLAVPAAIEPVLALLEAQYARPARDYELLRTALRLVLLALRQEVAPAAGGARSRAAGRLQAFRGLLDQEFRRWHRVAPYAAQLALSPKRLDQLCRTAFGKSAQRLLHERLALEAKRQLAYEATSVKEIAFGLGFDDPSYFSRFFRALAGTTPGEFRAQFPNSTRR